MVGCGWRVGDEDRRLAQCFAAQRSLLLVNEPVILASTRRRLKRRRSASPVDAVEGEMDLDADLDEYDLNDPFIDDAALEDADLENGDEMEVDHAGDEVLTDSERPPSPGAESDPVPVEDWDPENGEVAEDDCVESDGLGAEDEDGGEADADSNSGVEHDGVDEDADDEAVQASEADDDDDGLTFGDVLGTVGSSTNTIPPSDRLDTSRLQCRPPSSPPPTASAATIGARHVTTSLSSFHLASPMLAAFRTPPHVTHAKPALPDPTSR